MSLPGQTDTLPPVVLELHVADASLLLAILIDIAGREPHQSISASSGGRLARCRDELLAAMERWPA